MAIVGLDNVLKNLNMEIRKIEGRTLGGVLYAAEKVRAEAQKRTPVATGNLFNSAFVLWSNGVENARPKFKNPPGRKGRIAMMRRQHKSVISELKAEFVSNPKLTAIIGFSAPYATATHENPRAGKTGGISPSGRKYREGTYAKSGEWKFLETALKVMSKEVIDIIKRRAQIP